MRNTASTGFTWSTSSIRSTHAKEISNAFHLRKRIIIANNSLAALAALSKILVSSDYCARILLCKNVSALFITFMFWVLTLCCAKVYRVLSFYDRVHIPLTGEDHKSKSYTQSVRGEACPRSWNKVPVVLERINN